MEKKLPPPGSPQLNECKMTQCLEVFLSLPQALSMSNFTVEEAGGDQAWQSARWGLGKSCSHRQPVRLSSICNHIPPYPPKGIRGAQIAQWFRRTMGYQHVTWTLDSALSWIPHLVAAFIPRSQLPLEENSVCPFVEITWAL